MLSATAHPLTSPVGSKPPGIAQGSNHPLERALASSHRETTLLISRGASSSRSSPARNLLMGLCALQVLKMASRSCSLLQAEAMAADVTSVGQSPGSTCKENIVPMAGSTWTITPGASLGCERVER